jgi:lipid-A-disaccharide synthase
MRIGLIVGEESGDQLGAALIKALRKHDPQLEFEGILGKRLLALGGTSLFDAERLAVMGFIDPLKRLPELLRIRKAIIQHFIDNPPDVFIGIDAPDFNLTVELKLKQQGIPVVHYVSPSVWAWRKYRIKKIKKSVDLMLTLFPFENKIYEEHGVLVKCVGHPMADDIALEQDQLAARKELGIENVTGKLLAMLPGSRATEIAMMSKTFIQTAVLLRKQDASLHVAIPFVDESRRQQFMEIKKRVAPTLPITAVIGKVHPVLAASDFVLSTAGTATLEVLCFHKPLVVAYKTSYLNFIIAKCLVDLEHISLPNLVFGHGVVQEFLQSAATSENLAKALTVLMRDSCLAQTMSDQFREKHKALRANAGEGAAQEIARLLAAGVRPR